MNGQNKLILNQEILNLAVQYYLNTEVFQKDQGVKEVGIEKQGANYGEAGFVVTIESNQVLETKEAS